MSSERLEVEIIKIVKKYDELVAIETGHDQFLSYRQLLDEVQLLYKFFVDNFQITFGEHQQCLVRQCFNESVFLICLERSSINAIPSMLASLCLGGRFIFIPHDMIEREFDRLVEVLKPIAIITDGKLNEKLELLIKTYHKKEETELEKLREKFNASKYRRLTIDELKGNYIDDRENVGDIDQHFRVHRYYENYLKQKIFGCYETDEVISFDLPIIIDLSKLDRSKFEISKNWIPKRNMNCKNNSIAYFIYTSGTTSTSKLVPIYHKDLLHRLTTSSCFDGIYSTDRISQIFNLTFDASMMEIFGALLHAATIVIVPDEIKKSYSLKFALYLRDKNISLISLLPSQLHYLAPYAKPPYCCFDNAKFIICGGESLKNSTVEQICKISNVKLFNLYGSTETTIFLSSFNCSSYEMSNSLTPIGFPLPSVNFTFRNSHFSQTVFTGELMVNGIGIIEDYYKNPDASTKYLVYEDILPFSSTRWYCTGDLMELRIVKKYEKIQEEIFSVFQEQHQNIGEKFKIISSKVFGQYSSTGKQKEILEKFNDLSDNGFPINFILILNLFAKLGRANDLFEMRIIDRVDEQIKINGYRVDRHLIENLIINVKYEGRLIIDHVKIEKNFCCYYQLSKKNHRIPKNLGDFCKQELMKELPEYLIPKYFEEIENFEKNPSSEKLKLIQKNEPVKSMTNEDLMKYWKENIEGKETKENLVEFQKLLNEKNVLLSLSQLQSMNRSVSTEKQLWNLLNQKQLDEDEFLQFIVTSTREVLHRTYDDETINKYSNFLACGGHSLIAMDLLAKIYVKYEIEASMHHLFISDNLEQFAKKSLEHRHRNFSSISTTDHSSSLASSSD